MAQYLDQMGRSVDLSAPPRRIISVVPSQTELLHALGLEEEVIGITKFCVHPQAWFKSKTRVGGTKTLNLERIRALQPDLILANKEENTQADIEALAQDFPVWLSDIYTIDQALDMIARVGEICQRREQAQKLLADIGQARERLKLKRSGSALRVLYLIWAEPFMGAGSQTYIHDILENTLGYTNVLREQPRYPVLSPEAIQALNPDLILLSSEPFPFKAKHQAAYGALWPQARIELVDGELYSWYGSRLLKALDFWAEG